MHYKLAQLILTPSSKNNSTSEIYIAQPETQKENLVGQVLVLIEIESRHSDTLKFINFLINEIDRNYYNNEKAILRERVASIKIEQVFEAALAKTNKNLAEFLQSSELQLDLRQVNATVAVIHEDGLHFSAIGKNRSFLLHKNKTENGGAKYRLIDLTDQTSNEGDGGNRNPHKLFSNIVSGAVPQNGYFIFSNETLPEYLSAKQLTEIITTLPPTGAVEQMKNQLEQVNAYVSFLGIIIKNTLGQPVLEKTRSIALSSTAQASIASLKTTEEATEKLLTPSGIIDFKKWFEKLRPLTNLSLSSGGLTNQEKLMLGGKFSFGKRKSFKLVNAAWQNLKTTILFLAQFFVHLPEILNRQRLVELLKTSQAKTNSKAGRLADWFKSLSGKQKIFITAGIIFLFLFVQSSFTLNLNNKKAAEQLAHDGLVSSIEQKENQIESNLLFDNDEGARKLLSEIASLLEQLPTTDARYAALKNKFEEQNKKINHFVSVATVELANFTNLNNQAKPTNLVMAGSKLFSGDKDNQTIYSLDPQSKLVTAIKSFPEAPRGLNFPTTDDGKIYYYDGDGTVWQFDSQTESLGKLTLDFAGDKTSLAGFSLYNGSLYALSPIDRQIYRFSSTGNGYGNATAWLKSASDFGQNDSLAIDGSIYVIRNGNGIQKFMRGVKQNFNLAEIQPPLSGAAKIAVTAKSLYILEPKNKRLLSFDKSGKLTEQYYLENENNLKDFLIDEANGKAYLLSDTRVIEIKL